MKEFVKGQTMLISLNVLVWLLQTGSGSDNNLASVARLRVSITDVNDKEPVFQGLDVNGYYPAAVSDYTVRGDKVIFVSAIDVDTTDRYNKVSKFWHIEACKVSIGLALHCIRCLE